MKTRVLVGTIAATGLALGIGQMNAIALPAGEGEGLPSTGPDVIVGEIPDVARYAPGTFNGIQYASYAIGSTSCNIGCHPWSKVLLESVKKPDQWINQSRNSRPI